MKTWNLIALLCLSLALVACGTSPEELAAQTSVAATSTALSWTPTPSPSPEPTSTPTSPPTQTPEPGRHYEEAGGYSFIPPNGWEMTELPGFKYLVAFGPPIGQFTPNMLVVDEAFDGPIEEYAATNILSLESLFDPFDMTEPQVYSNGVDTKIISFEIRTVQQGNELRQILYIFDSGERKYILTCSLPLSAPADFDLLCDTAAATLRFED